jgi:hypothetical protein
MSKKSSSSTRADAGGADTAAPVPPGAFYLRLLESGAIPGGKASTDAFREKIAKDAKRKSG